MKCSKCQCEGFELFEHAGALYCQECVQEVTIPASVYSRIVGYMRPVDAWNAGKQQEFADRVVYRVPNDLPKAKQRALLATPFEVTQ